MPSAERWTLLPIDPRNLRLYSGSVPAPILATKLYIPPSRRSLVLRPRLVERLDEGLAAGHRLTLVSAPAGFGKTTLVGDWVAGCGRPAAWLSLDAGDSDPGRFLTYLVAALQTVAPGIGDGLLAVLQSPQPPPPESTLTALLNDVAAIPGDLVLVLDDYHVLDARPVDDALAFLVEHLPPRLHLVIATREDPALPLARLRARGQLTELRGADLRFTPSEAAEFLGRVMSLDLSAEQIAALETRTEGWIAGLQLAAISLQGRADAAGFIRSFAGSHHFVLDYLVEEVLQRQSEHVQAFLLRTSILDRLCGPLCDAVMVDASAPGQETLEYLERANLFLVPLDNDRRWYRYHHLFGDLLRQRLGQTSTPGNAAELHIRASQWCEGHQLEMEAFRHAAAANDVERAERLMEGKGIPQQSRAAVNALLEWLASLPRPVLDGRPLLWVRSATLALTAGQTTGVEEKLQAAEAALQGAELNGKTRNLVGQIATARATLALTQYQPESMIIQSRRALEYLSLDNLVSRSKASWLLSNAYQLQGDRAAASRALADALSISEASGDVHSTILAIIQLGLMQELENQLHRADETYRRALQLVSDQPQPIVTDAHLGLARICYEWNDLAAAEDHGQQGILLAREYDRVIDQFIICEVFLARVKLAKGDVNGAAALLTQADRATRQQNFVLRMPEVAAAQVLTLLRQGDVPAAARLVQAHDLPISQARVCLAQGDTSRALVVLEPLGLQMEAKGWQDERLRVMVLQAVALYAHGEKNPAMRMLDEALTLAEPGGFVRTFVDEGEQMRLLMLDCRSWIEGQAREGHKPTEYLDRLLTAFARPVLQSEVSYPESTIVDPLSQRELEILKLIAQGLSNREIGARLFLALDTVKGHNRRIFAKLQVQRRTEAIARARELGLL
jgi:LuxR family transcriptional regulator, maltose regulon positive regulatory protein